MDRKRGFEGILYVTIDTEMDADLHWKKKLPASFSSVTEGIVNILRPIWDRYQVQPIYFVSPEVVEDDACCRVLRREIKKGAVIGAHLHPEYIAPYKGQGTKGHIEQFPCTAYPRRIEKEKIKNLQLLIQNRLGVMPEWYRAARFGADTDTIAVLQELGFKYDSSFTPGIDWSQKGGPDHRRAPVKSYFIDLEDI